jgi:ribosomal-protein-serine acetyltransferase
VTDRTPAPFRADLGDGAVLRRYTLEDVDELWALVQAERERIGVWMPWVASTRTIEAQRAWLERVTVAEGLDGCGIWASDRYAGGAGLSWDPFGIAGEIGYWIGAEFEGRGLVTRACRALIEHGFGVVGLHRISIRAGVENARSRAIPERLGFTREGVLRGEGRGSGGFYDLIVYGLLEDEWSRA